MSRPLHELETSVVRATAEHIAAARGWIAAHGAPDIPPEFFSSCGFVVPGVAAVWLYFTDSALASLEFLVSNPAAPAAIRNAALSAVIDSAIAEARTAGVKGLTASIQRADVEARARRHGFEVLGRGLTTIGLALSNESHSATEGTRSCHCP